MTTWGHGRRREWPRLTQLGVVLALGMSLVACASDSPKAPSQTTPQAVRGNADRTFEKLKQEERERSAENQGVAR